MKLIRVLMTATALLCYSAGYALKIPYTHEIQTILLAIILVLDILEERKEGGGDGGKI